MKRIRVNARIKKMQEPNRKVGYWAYNAYYPDVCHCSVCFEEVNEACADDYDYCPFCGAWMHEPEKLEKPGSVPESYKRVFPAILKASEEEIET